MTDVNTPTPQSLGKLATALAKAQGEMNNAKKDKKNPFFKSQYADLASVFEACRLAFYENDISVTQTMRVEGERMILVTRLMHASGEYIDSEMLLPNQLEPQKMGSAITYYRRYSLMAIAGVAADDDDGNEANKQAKMHAHTTAKEQSEANRLEIEKYQFALFIKNTCYGKAFQ